MAELITPSLSTWNSHLINLIFWPEEAELIKAIPLGRAKDNEDRWMWHLTKNRVYFARSAYHAILDSGLIKDRCQSESTSEDRVQSRWKNLWNLFISNKVKHFIWGAIKNFLPTMVNLQRRKIMVDLNCPLCGYEREDVTHIFSLLSSHSSVGIELLSQQD